MKSSKNFLFAVFISSIFFVSCSSFRGHHQKFLDNKNLFIGKLIYNKNDLYASKAGTSIDLIEKHIITDMISENKILYTFIKSKKTGKTKKIQHNDIGNNFEYCDKVKIIDKEQIDVALKSASSKYNMLFYFTRIDNSKLHRIIGYNLIIKKFPDPNLTISKNDKFIIEFNHSRFTLFPFFDGSVINYGMPSPTRNYTIQKNKKYSFWVCLNQNHYSNNDLMLFFFKMETIRLFIEVNKMNLNSRSIKRFFNKSISIKYYINSVNQKIKFSIPSLIKKKTRNIIFNYFSPN